MRFVRFAVPGGQEGPRYGVVDDAEVAVIDPHPFATYRFTGERHAVAEIQLLAPVIPSKIVCVGRNYAEHAAELGNEVPDETLLFLKPSSAVIGPAEPVRLPTDVAAEFSYEGELAVVVGALLQRVGPEEASAGIFGYTIANDITARDIQKRENQWFRAKGFDSFCPLGPALATDLDASDLRIRTWVDDEQRQDGSTSQMIRGIASLVSEISHITTLLPSDVVLTGTPAGVGAFGPGNTLRVEIEGIGVLENPVVERSSDSSSRRDGSTSPGTRPGEAT